MDDAPFGTIEEAIQALEGQPGTIKILGEYDISTLTHEDAPWEGMVTITAGNDEAKLVSQEYQATIFNGPITIKDIKVEAANASHLNTNGYLFVYDPGEDVEFKSFMHSGTYGALIVDESYTVINSGKIPTIYTAGAYNNSKSNGVMGDATIEINGGDIIDLKLCADYYQPDMTGIAIGGNMNVIINGGNIDQIAYVEQTAPDIMGALNVIFNNGMEAPTTRFQLPEANGGVFIVKSLFGGKVMPTSEIGVFEVKANPGRIAVINGQRVPDGKVTLEEGETEVKFIKGEQPMEIKLTIDKAEIVKNGTVTALDVPAQIINDRTMVPLRAIFEALGATVEWNGETRTVTSEKGNTKISLAIDDTNLYVNGEAKVLDVPAQIVNDRTMVPARAIAEAYGCKVEWDNDTRTVTIKG
jgi:hypothetical protein